VITVNKNNDWIEVARFGRPHGVKGYITVHSLTEPKDNLLNYTDWCVFMNNQWIPLNVLALEQHSQCFVVLIEGYADRDYVAQLTNRTIAVKSAQLEALSEGEYYWHQLIGLTVKNTEGLVLGTVTEIMATGSNDVLVVSGDTRHLIPFRLGAVVTEVNLEQQLIVVDWNGEYL